MKCPNCGSSHQYRYGMTCSCGYGFCLDPKGDGIADGKFLAAVRAASANDTYYFTENQLYAALARKMARSPFGYLVAAFVFAGVFIATMLNLIAGEFAVFVAFFSAAGTTIMFVGAAVISIQGPLNRGKFDNWLRKWQRSGNPLEKLIVEPRLAQAPPEWIEGDIYDYGVEGILIVGRDELVDLFVLNRLHSEQRVLVLSESGYPEYLLPKAEELLAERPDLPVYLLHDSTPAGVTMRDRMQGWRVPIPVENITDLGLAPENVGRLKRLGWAKPSRHNNAVPVDYLLYSTLALGMAPAIAEHITLGMLIERTQRGSDYEGTSGNWG